MCRILLRDICRRAGALRIFRLSAVPLHRMSAAVAECFSVLKPGGLFFSRDYADQKVGFWEYKRSDGSRS
ncbi:putative methyltransferase [Helianthus anomalus]